MKIRRRHLLMLFALFAMAVLVGCFESGEFSFCDTDGGGRSFCCTGYRVANDAGALLYLRASCSGEAIEFQYGCPAITIEITDCDKNPKNCVRMWCDAAAGGDIWLADVCEPNDGFSEDGAMTWDSSHPGPLQFGPTMDGPWSEVEVNGPPWVVTEENMESFAGLVGVEDWNDMWVRSGEGYPQHVGNAVTERDARMDELCSVE
jgi:hypothetical protein